MKKIKRKPKKLKISACYIVKNNEDELKISIESLKHAVDEIIVVDTGSTDKTVEVAKSFGAKVFFREWDDDFSAPRNLAISKATGDWIIFLDSDEYFTDETKKNIRVAIEKAIPFNADALHIYRINLKKDDDGKFVKGAADYNIRILKNQSGLHYEGKIHEMPTIDGGPFNLMLPVPQNFLQLYHTGYAGALNKEKAKRNLKILLEELETTDNPKRIWHYIAGSYIALEDYEKAEKFARLDIESGIRNDSIATDSHKVLLSVLQKTNRHKELFEFLCKTVKDFPARPDFTADLAYVFESMGDLEKAIETMQAALVLYKNFDVMKEIEPTTFNDEQASQGEEKIKIWTEEIQSMKNGNRLKISACYIVKNNEEDLKISIESLKNTVDEIIVVDTGSTDKTVEVAKSFGAKVFFREWDDDFSAPRNLAISKATGDWIVFLDSDEYFVNDTAKNIRHVIKKSEKFDAKKFAIYRLNIDKDGNILGSDYPGRIFKNLPSLHYVGKIHEYPTIDGEKYLKSFPVPREYLMTYHTGYNSSVMLSKSERNLKILLSELAENDNPKRLYHYIAREYFNCSDFENAEKFARLDVETGKGEQTFASESYRILFKIFLFINKNGNEFEKFVKKAVEDFPAVPEFTYYLSECYAAKGDNKKAIEIAKLALKKYEDYQEIVEQEMSIFDEKLATRVRASINAWIEKSKQIRDEILAEQKKSHGKKIKISACYIVKNNETELKISIKSLKHAVDEIIVVDTGSTDKTVEVAKSFGAKVFFREWDDDFSAPRNLAISKASGDWIVFLDSDEFFTNETGKNIRPVIERLEEVKKNGLLVHLVNIDVTEKKILDTNFVMRILKNQDGLHYVGKIHEEPRVGEKILSDITFAPQNILTIFHTGYSANLNKSKAERNLKILLEELAETDEPQRIFGYIAECYNGLGDFVRAEKFARLDIESREMQKKFSTQSYRIILSILAKDISRSAEREKFAALAVKDFPALPEFTAELAECFAQQKNFPKAVETMKTAIEKFKNYKELEPTQFNEDMKKFAESRIKIWTEKISH